MKLLSQLDSLDKIQDGSTYKKLIPDGTTIVFNAENNQISVDSTPIASTSKVGGIKSSAADLTVGVDQSTGVASVNGLSRALDSKQGTLTPGTNIDITSAGVISATVDLSGIESQLEQIGEDIGAIDEELEGKQNTLTPGNNIDITDDVISAVDTKYTAGTNVTITGTNNAINASTPIATTSVTGGLKSSSNNLSVAVDSSSGEATINGLSTALGDKQDKLIAGNNIKIENDGKTISATDTKYTAGTNVSIVDGVISATDTNTTYSAGTNVTITGTNNAINASTPIATASVTGGLRSSTNNYSVAVNATTGEATVNGLATALGNVYTKSETYSQTEVNNLLDAINSFEYLTADELPTASADTMYKIYLVPNGGSAPNIKDEYVTIRSGSAGSYTYSWELLGTTQVDLSGYQEKLTPGTNIQIAADGKTISATDTKYTAGTNVTISGTNNAISASTPIATTEVTGGIKSSTTAYNIAVDSSTGIATVSGLSTALSGKQDKLTAGSLIDITNNVISVDLSGVTTYLPGEEPTGNVDGTNKVFTLSSAPAASSAVMVYRDGQLLTLNGDYTISGSTLTFLNAPMVGSILRVYYQTTTASAGNADTLDNLHASDFQKKLTAGTNITIASDGTISATGGANYTAGAGIDITDNIISCTAKGSGYYGTCATPAATAAKEVVCTDFTELTTGATIAVKFDYALTVGSPTLNVNSTGAKSVMSVGTTAAAAYQWQAGEVVNFVYDGTNWVMADGGIADTTYYGVTKLSSSTSSTSTTLAATASAVKAAYDLASSKVDPLAAQVFS